jgi:hypothetical protein
MRIDVPFERSCDTQSIPCPVCNAPAGEPCPQGPNHVERGRQARWERMDIGTSGHRGIGTSGDPVIGTSGDRDIG